MMKSSPYIKPIMEKVVDLEGKIVNVQDALQEVLKC